MKEEYMRPQGEDSVREDSVYKDKKEASEETNLPMP